MIVRTRIFNFAMFWAALCLIATVPNAQAQAAGILSSLEVGSYKTDIEYLSFPLDQPLSASRFDYTATVDQSYTAKAFITTCTPTGTNATFKIDNVPVKSGEPYPVDLKMGDNDFTIAVASTEATPSIYHLKVTRKDLSKEYISTSLGKGIWRVEDFGGSRGNESFYLIEGSSRALVLDTGMGRGDLAGYLRTLTSLPIDVALTHGHGDHFGQVDRFKDSTVYMSEKDARRLPPAFITPKFKWLKDGDLVDLGGGRQFEAIDVPGHSLGSIIYLDRRDKIAVTGDAVSSGSMVYMFGSTSSALDEYLESLKRLEARVRDIDSLTLLVGHQYQEKTPLTGATGKELLTDMRIAAERVLNGEMAGKEAMNVRDRVSSPLRQAYYGVAGLWYNPANLRTNPAALGLLAVKTGAGNRIVLKPEFASMVTNYHAKLPDGSTSFEVTPTAYWPDAKSIIVNGVAVKSGATQSLQLTHGSHTTNIAVTALDGSVRTYTVFLEE